jgi:hypothetical protein
MMDWIDEIAQQDELKREHAAAEAQEAYVASLLLDRDEPEFIRQLGLELKAMVEKLDKIGVRGSFSDHSEPNFETRFHINLQRVSLSPAVNQTGVFYQPSSHIVRCHPMRRSPFQLRFAVDNGRVFIYSEINLAPMNPHQAAQFILQPEVDYVRPRS